MIMVGVKKETKKVAATRKRKNFQKKKVVKTKKKELPNLVPRLRLEPRLIPSVPNKIKDSQSTVLTGIEKYKRLVVLVDKNEVDRYLENHRSPCKATSVISRDSSIQSSHPSNIDNAEFSAQNAKRNLSPSFSKFRKRADSVAQKKEKTAKKKEDLRCRGKWWWSDVELKNLALGLQKHGFADLDKVADVVKTKSKDAVALFIKPRRWEFYKDEKYDHDAPRLSCYNSWTTIYPEHLKTWPNIRKWRRIAFKQVIPHVRKIDYSEPVIASLCKQFYEEEEEPTDPQVINVKLIYKYMMDCMAGQIPPQLPPKESALVLDMLRDVRSLPLVHDFEEEKEFLQKFKSATTFTPFAVKDEFRKKLKKEDDKVDACPSNSIPVPEEVFLDLSRHKKLMQSFNPLVTPVWMIQNGQEQVKKYSEESNVYVD